MRCYLCKYEAVRQTSLHEKSPLGMNVLATAMTSIAKMPVEGMQPLHTSAIHCIREGIKEGTNSFDPWITSLLQLTGFCKLLLRRQRISAVVSSHLF